LPSFEPSLSEAAKRALERLGVEVKLENAARECDAVWAAGDKPLPGVAPVAKQEGAYVAARIVAELRGETPTLARLRLAGRYWPQERRGRNEAPAVDRATWPG
jgi:NADH dehydrogenase FAD-containing subunit